MDRKGGKQESGKEVGRESGRNEPPPLPPPPTVTRDLIKRAGLSICGLAGQDGCAGRIAGAPVDRLCARSAHTVAGPGRHGSHSGWAQHSGGGRSLPGLVMECLCPWTTSSSFPPFSPKHTHRCTHPHPTGCVAAGAWWSRLSADGCLLGPRAQRGHQGEEAGRRASAARLCRVSLGSSCLLHACLPAMNTAIAACRKTDSLSPNTRREEREGGD